MAGLYATGTDKINQNVESRKNYLHAVNYKDKRYILISLNNADCNFITV